MWWGNERRLDMLDNDIKIMLYIMAGEAVVALLVIVFLGLNGMLI